MAAVALGNLLRDRLAQCSRYPDYNIRCGVCPQEPMHILHVYKSFKTRGLPMLTLFTHTIGRAPLPTTY